MGGGIMWGMGLFWIPCHRCPGARRSCLGASGPFGPLPAVKPERLLSVRLRDLYRGAREWAGRADSGRSRSTIEPLGSPHSGPSAFAAKSRSSCPL
jgi:hypothetical protein